MATLLVYATVAASPADQAKLSPSIQIVWLVQAPDVRYYLAARDEDIRWCNAAAGARQSIVKFRHA
jgi:hypothetical protein